MSVSDQTFALVLPPNEVRRGYQTAAYFAAFIALGLTTGSLGPTLPSLATQTGVGLGAISYLFTARSLGYVFGSFSSGKLFDSKPTNIVLGTMLLLMSLSMVLVPLTSHLAVMLVVMLLLGAAESGVDVGGNTLLLRLHGVRVAPLMTALHSCFGIGALIAPLIVAATNLNGYSASDSYFVLALLIVPIAAVGMWPSPTVSRASVPPSKSGVVDRSLVFLIALFLFLYVGAEVGFAGWIYTFAVEQKLSAPVTSAYLTSVFWASLTAGRILMIPVANRISPPGILFASLTGSLAGVALLIIAPSSMYVLFAGTIGTGLSMAAIFPAALSFAGRRMEITGGVTSWFVVGASLGSTLIPLAIGQLFHITGPQSLVYVAAFALLLAAVVLIGAVRTTRR